MHLVPDREKSIIIRKTCVRDGGRNLGERMGLAVDRRGHMSMTIIKESEMWCNYYKFAELPELVIGPHFRNCHFLTLQRGFGTVLLTDT